VNWAFASSLALAAPLSARSGSYRIGGLELEDKAEARWLLERPFRMLCRDEASRLALIGVIRDVVGDDSGLPNDGRGLHFKSEGRCIECRISLHHSTAGAPL
jgi:hypothetical protein